MGIFVSLEKTIECVIAALLFTCALTFAAYKQLGALQACGYSNKKFWRWLKKKSNMTFARLALLALSCLLTCGIISLCFSFAGAWACVIGLAAYAIFFALYAYADSKVALRCPVKLTARLKRLYAVFWFLTAVFVYLAFTLLNFADAVWGNEIFRNLKYCALAVFPLLLPPILSLSALVCGLYENPKNAKYVRTAKEKLTKSDIITVAVTGSYGKTGVKNILTAMLSLKYRVLATPASYNTPLGVAATVNSAELQNYDVFVVEMGARNVGDIAELCAVCPPDYSVITGVCAQHIDSFKNIENVIKTKAEIIAATKNKCVIPEKFRAEFSPFGGNAEFCDCVSDVRADCSGTAFTLTLGGNSVNVKCKLLGEHSAYNIGLAAFAAFSLGMDLDSIASAISSLEYTEHRLQLICANGVNIIDDGYNSNPVGAEAAVNVLKLFGGKKICITPGLVEMGVLEESANMRLGELLCGLDFVILVGETLVGAVKNGYLSAGGDKDRIVTVPSLAAAQDALKGVISAGDAVLFLNDLPDVYF